MLLLRLSSLRFAACLLIWAVPAAAEPFSVRVENATRTTACAEEDNVYVKLFSPKIQALRIDALQPAYMTPNTRDVSAPDFTDCKFEPHKDVAFEPKKLVLYEDARLLVRGFTFERFWREADVPTKIGRRTVRGLHLIQVFSKRGRGEPFEFLVLYPPDGYWRARPRPVPGLGENVYGASFLLGPIEERERPIADVASVEFLPARRTFVLHFRAGGSARLSFGEPDSRRLRMSVRLERGNADPARPFAALRSMFVSETNADTARVVWIDPDGTRYSGRTVPRFDKTEATEVFFDRAVPSTHNTSAPDMRFGDFKP